MSLIKNAKELVLLVVLCLIIAIIDIGYGGFRLGITGAVKKDMKRLDEEIKKGRQETVSSSPTELVARVKSTSEIVLTWKDNSEEDGFKIERKVQNGSYNQINTVNQNITSYSDTELNIDTRYYYRIRAYKGTANSSYSNEVYAKTLAGIYNSPSGSPSGLAWDGTNLWSCDSFTGKIYKHNMDATLSVANTYDAPGGSDKHPTGLAWDGSNLWSCNLYTDKIYKHNMDATLSIDASYDIRWLTNDIDGLTWDGTNLWSCASYGSKAIWKHNMDATLSIAATYVSEDGGIADLAWDGSNIFSLRTYYAIFKHKMDANLSVISIYEFEQPDDPITDIPSGLTWDGNYFWSCDTQTDKIYKH